MNSLALFDLGSSSLKGDWFVLQEGRLAARRSFSRVTGLGAGVLPGSPLPEEGKKRTAETLAHWMGALRAEDCPRFSLWGTEALRRAADGRAFLEELKTALNADGGLLTSSEEGLLSHAAWQDRRGAGWLLADLGGRSCELCDGASVISLTLGIVEGREFLKARPLDQWIGRCEDRLADQPFSPDRLAVAGGAAVIIARLLGRPDESPISAADLERLTKEMEKLQPSERAALPAVPEDWEPNLLPALGALTALARFAQGTFTSCATGWRHGLAKKLLG